MQTGIERHATYVLADSLVELFKKKNLLAVKDKDAHTLVLS